VVVVVGGRVVVVEVVDVDVDVDVVDVVVEDVVVVVVGANIDVMESKLIWGLSISHAAETTTMSAIASRSATTIPVSRYSTLIANV